MGLQFSATTPGGMGGKTFKATTHIVQVNRYFTNKRRKIIRYEKLLPQFQRERPKRKLQRTPSRSGEPTEKTACPAARARSLCVPGPHGLLPLTTSRAAGQEPRHRYQTASSHSVPRCLRPYQPRNLTWVLNTSSLQNSWVDVGTAGCP